MKKIIISLFIGLVILFIYIASYRVSVTPEEMVVQYKERWDVELPVPNEIIDVWSTKYPARGDGEWVNELRYDLVVNPEQLRDFEEVTDENLIAANRLVNNFINRVQNMYKIQQDEAFKNVIAAYTTNLKPGDYYFHRSENGDFDTFTAIYQKEENRMLLFQWHQ
ncbi:hypothetical protein [Solibacillus sp. FSL W8-0372]|uniref:hypothetical protein n=1 Tax=Solibacillus sp. FSL W8-0372 TaxID=2921713 RepID=UPI0030CD26AC